MYDEFRIKDHSCVESKVEKEHNCSSYNENKDASLRRAEDV